MKGQARPLIGLPDDAAEDIMERAIREEWSARRIEQVVTLWKQAKASPIENKRRQQICLTQMLLKVFQSDLEQV